MLGNFGYMTNLQYKVRGLQHELESFNTGEKYIQMDLKFRRCLTRETVKSPD